jgi:DNA-binding MarR family transcriptional regulator
MTNELSSTPSWNRTWRPRAPNQGHRRSSLVKLTPAGQRVIARMRSREARLYAQSGAGLRRRDLDVATMTLAQALGGEP